ncbi:hypothetical protein AVEN_266347-1 [Araneus ventricosus]|uniref:Uncharacterized protein n=1 Tax=Araneus ventricosus TaxID=182803 RepID=A0A4Y2CPR2_ARAVE|nr:hypothetical protein AVEN_266347-1 [Araneus ventricosus]
MQELYPSAMSRSSMYRPSLARPHANKICFCARSSNQSKKGDRPKDNGLRLPDSKIKLIMLSGRAFFSCKLLSLRVGALLSVCCIIRQKFVCLVMRGGRQLSPITDLPGRPPKRATMVGINPNGANHSMLLKKSRMDGEYPGYENGHIGGDRVDKSHLLANGYSHHVAAAQAAVVAATAGGPPHLNPLPFMALNHAAAAAAHHNSMLSGTLPLAASSSHGHLNSSTSSGRGPESSSVIKERNSHTNDVINSTR